MEPLFKEDFIATMVEHAEKTKEEAERLWEEYGQKYVEDVWEDMAARMMDIVNLEEKRNG